MVELFGLDLESGQAWSVEMKTTDKQKATELRKQLRLAVKIVHEVQAAQRELTMEGNRLRARIVQLEQINTRMFESLTRSNNASAALLEHKVSLLPENEK